MNEKELVAAMNTLKLRNCWTEKKLCEMSGCDRVSLFRMRNRGTISFAIASRFIKLLKEEGVAVDSFEHKGVVYDCSSF